MYCSQCGVHCPEDARFCHQCGAKLYLAPEEQTEPIFAYNQEECDELILEEEPIPELPSLDETAIEASVSEEQEEPEAPEELEELEETIGAAENRGKRSVRTALLVLLGMLFVGIVCYTLLSNGAQSKAAVADPDSPWLSVTTDGTLFFRQEQYSGGNELILPDTVSGVTVTALADRCFAKADQLIGVQLPSSLETVGSRAFADCTALRGMFLPQGVTKIDSYAFDGCSGLEAISIPNSVTSIAGNAFENCPKLQYVFFDGTYAQWTEVFHSYITPYTQIICTDGTYLQRQG